MDSNVDIDKIELSKSERSLLASIQKSGYVTDELLGDERYEYLLRLNLIKHCYTEKFPYEYPVGQIALPMNALCVTDAGRQYLARTVRIGRENLVTRWIAIAAVLISLAAFIRSLF